MSKDTYLHGLIRLSDIPKDQIRTLQSGKKAVFVDIKERRTPSQDGKTHYLSMRVRNANGGYDTIYLGDFEEKRFPESSIASSAPAPAPAPRPSAAPVTTVRVSPAPASAPDSEEEDIPF